MEKLSEITEKILNERFGKDSLIALATCVDNMPYVRTVNTFYYKGAFYILTYALPNKMKQLVKNPIAAISGEWFTAHGKAENLGWFCKTENTEIAEKMRSTFSSWIDNGHNNFDDKNTCILKIGLINGVLFSNGNCYEIDFT